MMVMNDDDDYPEIKTQKVEEHTVASRERLRKQLSDEVAEFLARGGKIQLVDPNVTAEIPLNVGDNYGRQPL